MRHTIQNMQVTSAANVRRVLCGSVFRLIQLLVLCVGIGIATAPAVGSPFPAEIGLSDLLPSNGGDGSSGFTLYGLYNGDYAGSSVDTAGDVNGDGLDDILIGAPFAEAKYPSDVGHSYVVFGVPHSQLAGEGPEFELSGLLAANGGDGSRGFTLIGSFPIEQSGLSVGSAGDVNGDGLDDLIIGAPEIESPVGAEVGRAYVVFGRDDSGGPPFPAEFQLSSLFEAGGGDGSLGFVLVGAEPNDYTGLAVGAAGDVNHDGLDDVFVLMQRIGIGDSRLPAGRVYVVYGRQTGQGAGFPAEFELASLLEDTGGDDRAGFVIEPADYDRMDSAGVAGDINGDGIDDLVIGATQSREVYVVFGRLAEGGQPFPSTLELESLKAGNGGDGTAGFVLHGNSDWRGLGGVVGTAGDVNADGVDDLVVGAYFARLDYNGLRRGAALVLFGRSALGPGGFPAETDVSSLLAAHGGDGSHGFVLEGIDADDFTGWSVAGAGDVNFDGIADLVVGAPTDSCESGLGAGRSFVVFGRDASVSDRFPAEFDLGDLLSSNGGDGTLGFAVLGVDAGDCAGTAVAFSGDINGDTIDDLIVGAPAAVPPSGGYAIGETYVIFGRADTDGDGVHDLADNCRLAANADQRDTNGDGFGNRCDADLSNDCRVDFADLGILKSVFSPRPYLPDADFDGDGFVGFSDVALMKQSFFSGSTPGPGPGSPASDCD